MHANVKYTDFNQEGGGPLRKVLEPGISNKMVPNWKMAHTIFATPNRAL